MTMFPYPPRLMLRAVWSVGPLPADYLDWRRNNARKAIAYHEAGHALLMQAYGVAGVHAVLSADGCDGEVYHVAPLHAPATSIPIAMKRTNAILAAAAYHAGIEAEQLVGGFTPPMGTEWRCARTTDHELADAIFGDLFFRGRPHGYTKAVARAALSNNLDALDRIAECLIDTGTWQPGDTGMIDIQLGEQYASVSSACTAYDAAPATSSQTDCDHITRRGRDGAPAYPAPGLGNSWAPWDMAMRRTGIRLPVDPGHLRRDQSFRLFNDATPIQFIK